MIGNPSVFRLNKNRLKCQIGTETYPIGSYTEGVFWGYNGGYKVETTFLPHCGYWISARAHCFLVFPETTWDDPETKGISSFN